MKPKVAYFTNIAPHYREKLWLSLAKDLGVEFHFYFGYKPDQSIKSIDFTTLDWKDFKDQVHLINNIEYQGILFWQTKVLREVLFKKWDAVILLGHARIYSVWLAAMICRFKGIPVIMWGHGLYGSEGYLKKRFLKTFLSLSSVVLVYGEYAKKLLIGGRLKEKNINVIYNSINYELAKQQRTMERESNFFKKYFNNTNETLIFIGRITKHKKLSLLLDVLIKLKIKDAHYNLMLIGDGDDRQNLEKKAEANNLNVHFYGACYREEEIGRLMSNADLCISPGSVGLTAVHAMSYGTPVCTHNDLKTQGPEFEAIIPNKTGCFFDKERNNLAETIMKWFNYAHDREEVRRNCYEVIDKKYNPIVQLQVLKKTLENLI